MFSDEICVKRLQLRTSGARRLRPSAATRTGRRAAARAPGTSTVRTTSVSSSTPMQMIVPSWASTTSGSTPRTAKTAASRMPALVMTPPVAVSARSMPSRVPCSARLLAGPGDQEDVVVDAERDQEQERQQRHADVERLEAEQPGEQPPRDARGWRRRSPARWPPAAAGRPPTAAAGPAAPAAPAPRISGTITSRSRCGAVALVDRVGLGAADVGVGERREVVAQGQHGVLGASSSPGAAVEHDVDLGDAVALLGDPRPRTRRRRCSHGGRAPRRRRRG